MELKLRSSLAPLAVALLAASGCTPTEDRIPDLREDAQVAVFDGGADAGPLASCEPGEINCGGTCTRVAGDSLNCGSCGNVCPSGFTCAVGRCDCAAPMTSCDGLCIDPASDTQNCGACGNVCATGETCLDGACTVQCEEPIVRCSNRTPTGEQVYVCADLQSDAANCGACNTRCAGGATCQDGRCACPSGQVNCSGVCTDLATDANNCGTCLNSCGAEGVCEGGTCTTCGAGLSACGSPARCVDTASSRLHCGVCSNACGPGEGCDAGACTCLPGFTDCDGLCANLTGDPHNCGGCGIDCGPGGTCSAGVCTCAPDVTACGPECAVLSSNAEHCGACGAACAALETCYESTCLLVNNRCENAEAVTIDRLIRDETTLIGGTVPTGDGCGFGTGDEGLYYAVTVPPGQEVTVVATSDDDLVLFEQEAAACGEMNCIRYSDFPESLTLANAGTSDLHRIVGVRPYSSGIVATFDIEFSYSTAVFAANALCATATPITADTNIPGEDTGLGGPRPYGSNCGFGGASEALYYAVTIPAGQRVDVTTTTGGDLVLFEQAACTDTACVDYSDFPESLALDNSTGTSDVTRFVAVRAYSTNTTYAIDFSYSTPVVAANASCATATPITADATITGEDTETGGPRATGLDCGGGGSDKALYYAVTIPAGQTVDVTTSTDGSPDLVVFEQAACGDLDCAQSSDSPESLTLDNSAGTSDVTRIVGVRGYNAPGGSFAGGVFDITFTYASP